MNDLLQGSPVNSVPRENMADTNKKRNPVKKLASGGAKAFNTAGKAIVAPVRNVVAPKQSKEVDPNEQGKKSASLSEQISETFTAPVKAIGKGGEMTYKAIAKSGGEFAHRFSKGGVAEEEDWEAPTVPPDTTLQNMNVIITKRLKRVSVKNFYETVWSEGNRTDKGPFYRPWLESDKDKQNISVEDWTFADETEEKKIVADWNGEEYSQKRIIMLRFSKSAFTADVTDTHYCRVEEDRCILAMSVKTEGVPFADCFVLEIRWVATRVGTNDLLIEVGLFVNFNKSTMLASKIKSASTQEARKGQLNLFESMKGACGAEVEEVAEKVEVKEKPLTCSALGVFLSQLLGGPSGGILSSDVELRHGIVIAERKLKKIQSILQSKDDLPEQDKDIVRDDMDSLNELLEKMLSTLQ